jgi:hypothetical protein
MDLLTRGAGFGYFGSALTSLVYASVTVIFLSSSSHSRLDHGPGIPARSAFPCRSVTSRDADRTAIRAVGLGAVAKMQTWTQPLWIVGLILPFVALAIREPGKLAEFASFGGTEGAGSGFSAIGFGLGMGITLSLIGQIGEQADYLRSCRKRRPRSGRGETRCSRPGGAGSFWARSKIVGALLAFLAIGAVGKNARWNRSRHISKPSNRHTGRSRRPSPRCSWCFGFLSKILGSTPT